MNFMKNSLFQRNLEQEREEEMPEEGGVLAVWGSPSSGKTVVSVKLAEHLAKKKRNVILILADMITPPLPYLCAPSDIEQERSLGSILAASHVTENLIKKNCMFYRKNDYLSMVGMLKGENVFTYPPYEKEQAAELLQLAAQIAPYVIVDCTSNIASDILSAVALMEADTVLRLAGCDLKSISYLSSQLPLLSDHKWDADKQLKAVSNIRQQEASSHMEQILGSVSFQIPHSSEVEAQFLEGELLGELGLKESRAFRREIEKISREVQEYISSKYSTLMVEGGSEEVKQQVKRYITKYICDYRITVKGKTQEQLIDDLYTEMAEFSFLTKYIFGTGIEEIDINSWRDIEIQYNDGRCEKLEEHFESPEHAVNVIRRMLHVSGMVLDNASPAVLGHLSKNIRIAVLKTPLVDEDVGIAASIRIVNPQSLKKENFVDGGTATGEMLDFLAECLRYGISICVAGATSSGKTTLAGWLLTTIPDGKRIFTIENGSRELALVREKDGKVTNSVIHTLTRYSENEKQNIDQDMLLDMALRFNPEIICVGEMRSSEAYTAQESARTGHTVLTTIHSNSCESTYSRMRTLCKRKYDMDDEVLMDLVTEAFPIVVFTKQLENRKRKLMEIMECEITADGKRKFNPLYRYEITENRMEGDRFIINGTHKKVCGISESLKKRFLENGMPKDVLERIEKGGEKAC